METTAGIRELKAKLSAYLRKVRAGESVVVTDRGEPVARLVPVGRDVSETVRELMDAGLVEWDGGSLEALEPVAHPRGRKTVADILLESRE